LRNYLGENQEGIDRDQIKITNYKLIIDEFKKKESNYNIQLKAKEQTIR